MRNLRLKMLLTLTAPLWLAACSTPQYALHPVSNTQLTDLRSKLDATMDRFHPRGFSMGAYLAPTHGSFFQTVPVTDSRHSMVYIYRPHSTWNEQEVIAPSLFLNDRRLHGLKDGSYFWLELPAGHYDLSARRPLGPVYLGYIFKTEIAFEGGKTYFLRYDEEGFRLKPDKKLGLLQVGPLAEMPEDTALTEIRETRLDQPGYGFATEKQTRWQPFRSYAQADHEVPEERIEMQRDATIGREVVIWNPRTW